jgi:hypothetical protein
VSPGYGISGKYVVQISFDMGPLAGKVTGRQELEVAR